MPTAGVVARSCGAIGVVLSSARERLTLGGLSEGRGSLLGRLCGGGGLEWEE